MIQPGNSLLCDVRRNLKAQIGTQNRQVPDPGRIVQFFIGNHDEVVAFFCQELMRQLQPLKNVRFEQFGQRLYFDIPDFTVKKS